MASLIPGYEYDIFISYRQKDNKGDRWVSEFVEALKTELESTFKKEISLYFDINPHDGLLETHDVDASLKEKLKCLVFIPVLSRTYCDPTSFAWGNEFKAFIKQASGDQFGLNVKLSNGNMTSRILPVRIHDLDPEDIRLLETEIDLIHPVDFVYYSEGVNRPLRKQDDTSQDLKQLIYRDQVNKTALAIKGIIQALMGKTDLSFKAIYSDLTQPQERIVDETPAKSIMKKLLIGAGTLALLVITVLFFYPGIIHRQNTDKLISKAGKIPIAVMPFQNMTNDTSLAIWQQGIQSILITNLSNSEDLKVRKFETITGILESRGLTYNASLTPTIAGSISQKLETNVNIQGSIKRSGNTLRVNAQLVDTKTGEAFKTFQIDGTEDSIMPVIDTLSVRILKFLILSVMKKELPADARSNISTSSPEALRYFLNGTKAPLSGPLALECYQKAVVADSNFFYGLNALWFTYLNMGMYKQGKQVCLRINRKKNIWGLSERLWADYQYAYTFQTPAEQIQCLKLVIEDDELDTSIPFVLGYIYTSLGQYDKAIPELEKSLELCKKWEMKPVYGYLINLGDTYHKAGLYRKEKKVYKIAEKYYPDDHFLIFNQALLALTEGDTVLANQYIKKWNSLIREQLWSEARILMNLAWLYSKANYLDKAEELYRKALFLESESSLRLLRLNVLSYFLIDKDRNVIEGMELVERVLESNPENYDYLHTKGWGLYKQGHYKEAFDILQKSWDLRMENALYDHTAFLHLEAAKKAVAGLK